MDSGLQEKSSAYAAEIGVGASLARPSKSAALALVFADGVVEGDPTRAPWDRESNLTTTDHFMRAQKMPL
jgi:hypothetical protein